MSQDTSQINLMILAGTILLLGLIIFIVLFMFFYQGRYYKQEKKILEIKEESQRELLRAQLEIKEEELKRVSQEIHDNTGQMLSLVKLNLNVVQSRLNEHDINHPLVQESKSLVGNIISDLRNLSRSLSSDLVERTGFVQALTLETERIQKTGLFKCTLITTGNITRLGTDSEVILFRIAQESLQNILKHAKAKNIKIEVNFTKESLRVLISDDGIGFNPLEPQNGRNKKTLEGLGLRNLHSRARLIGAELQIHSNPGDGTCVEFSIPLHALNLKDLNLIQNHD